MIAMSLITTTTTPQHFDIGRMLYDQYSALAIGWVVAFAEAAYIIFLHSRINSIWRSHVNFATKVIGDMKPYLEAQTLALGNVVVGFVQSGKDGDRRETKIDDLCERQALLMGRLGLDIPQRKTQEVTDAPAK